MNRAINEKLNLDHRAGLFQTNVAASFVPQETGICRAYISSNECRTAVTMCEYFKHSGAAFALHEGLRMQLSNMWGIGCESVRACAIRACEEPGKPAVK